MHGTRSRHDAPRDRVEYVRGRARLDWVTWVLVDLLPADLGAGAARTIQSPSATGGSGRLRRRRRLVLDKSRAPRRRHPLNHRAQPGSERGNRRARVYALGRAAYRTSAAGRAAGDSVGRARLWPGDLLATLQAQSARRQRHDGGRQNGDALPCLVMRREGRLRARARRAARQVDG